MERIMVGATKKDRVRNTYLRYKTKGRDIIHEIKTKNGDDSRWTHRVIE
jgi:hypothetical protein